jgi:hypothetical protein
MCHGRTVSLTLRNASIGAGQEAIEACSVCQGCRWYIEKDGLHTRAWLGVLVVHLTHLGEVGLAHLTFQQRSQCIQLGEATRRRLRYRLLRFVSTCIFVAPQPRFYCCVPRATVAPGPYLFRTPPRCTLPSPAQFYQQTCKRNARQIFPLTTRLL